MDRAQKRAVLFFRSFDEEGMRGPQARPLRVLRVSTRTIVFSLRGIAASRETNIDPAATLCAQYPRLERACPPAKAGAHFILSLWHAETSHGRQLPRAVDRAKKLDPGLRRGTG
jgi:hypothetical protein